MAKQLTSNELHVLQENLDLFGSEPPAAATKRKPRKAKSGSGQKSKMKPTTTPQASHQQDVFSPTEESEPQPIQSDTKNKSIEKHPMPVRQSEHLLIAARAPSAMSAADKIAKLGYKVTNYGMEKRDPALKNMSDALLEKGMEYRLGKQTLHWLLLENNPSNPEILHHNSVELVLDSDWFEEQKHQIRRLKGIEYIDACAKIADKLPLKDQTRSLEA